MESNIFKLQEGKLSKEELKEALSYVCYERNIHYLSTNHYKLDKFPLFYLDRFVGWKYSESPEPIIPILNGFQDLIDNNFESKEIVKIENLRSKLKETFENSNKVTLPMWVDHSDGTEYVTSVLLEGMDEKNVYYTKTNETWNRICSPIRYEEFEQKIALEVDNSIEISVLKDLNLINLIKEMKPLEAYKYIFYNVYKYNFIENKFIFEGKEIEFDLNGLDFYIKDLKESTKKILIENGVPKYYQFRMYKHIDNKIRPILNLLTYIRENSDFHHKLAIREANICKEICAKIENSLKQIQKFASLVVQRPEQKTLNYYINSIEELKKILPEFQYFNYEIMKQLLKED